MHYLTFWRRWLKDFVVVGQTAFSHLFSVAGYASSMTLVPVENSFPECRNHSLPKGIFESNVEAFVF